MSSLFELGQKVVVFDHLIRTKMSGETVEELKKLWVNPPMKLSGNAWQNSLQYNVWVPHSIWKNRATALTGRMTKKSRERPANILFPIEGLVIQEAVLQDGTSEWDEFGSYFSGMNYKKGYKVAYDLRRKPLLVSEDMIREL